MLRAMGRKSLLDFLRNAKNTHEDLLSQHFNTLVTIDKIERHLVKNVEFSIDDEYFDFEFEDIYTAFSTYRKNDKVYLTFWR